ncbi:MAG TPA: thiol peroxidase [Deltaproteobacteria bacterium]|jgi:thiol peroxidase|nr:thiol peroxidase [Deltaproteobacteria bacterium]
MERTGVITFAGNPLTLVGDEVRVGDRAPQFTVVDRELKPVSLSDFQGKVKLISVTPSLDTPVCDLQARTFNEEAAALPETIAVLNISMDLPFAIARFCGNAGIEKIETLSDYKDASFGTAYGVLIKELRLLSRAIFVIDQKDTITYVEMVPEITKPPNYDKALSEAKKLIG